MRITQIIISIFIFMILGCNKSIQSNENRFANKAIDTVATEEIEIKTDTLIKISKPFLLNGRQRYWHHFLTI